MGSASLPVRLLLLLLLFLCLGCVRGDIQADAEALLRFLRGLDAAPKLINWSNTSNPCTSWHGVTCTTAQDAVQNLKLPGSGLYGSIQPNTLGSLPGLRILSLRQNKLSGPFPSDLTSSRSLRKLYLQNNLLSGPLPSFHANSTPSLSVLDLSFNAFSGSIPSSFSSLTNLRLLFLQNNSLSGIIPPLASGLTDLNLSNNRLSGAIPSSLSRFPSSDFSGNAQLCGPPLRLSCPSPPPSSNEASPPPPAHSASPEHGSKKHLLRTIDIVLIVVSGAALVLLISACCLLWYYKKQSAKSSSSAMTKPEKTDRAFAKAVDDSKDEYSSAQEPEHSKLVFFQGGQLTFDLEDLLRASAEVLGKGSFGTAYKAVLEDGPTVVVKRLKEVSVGRKEFEQQMDSVGRIRHRNLVPMRAYYYSKEEKLLVHEYMPLGSLSAALHGGKILSGEQRGALDWVTRVKVALAAAKGIAHVHASSSGGKQLVHGDIKSSNVLLHGQHDACVSDFGLTPLFTSNAVVSRMVGYRAPEVTETRRLTQKSDVYSFGVVLLELLTGKAPSQTSAEEGMDLPRWVQSVVREEWTSEVFDRELIKFENIEEEMVQMLQVALSCVHSAPDVRPTMAEAVRMIHDVRRPEVLGTDAESLESGGINPLSSSTDDTSNESSAAPPPPLETPTPSSTTLDPSTDRSASQQ